jgi:hypothetical protein
MILVLVSKENDVGSGQQTDIGLGEYGVAHWINVDVPAIIFDMDAGMLDVVNDDSLAARSDECIALLCGSHGNRYEERQDGNDNAFHVLC